MGLEDDIVLLVNQRGFLPHLDMDLLKLLGGVGTCYAIDTLNSLVEAGRLVEVEYILPNSHKVRSLYFPAGTDITVKRKT